MSIRQLLDNLVTVEKDLVRSLKRVRRFRQEIQEATQPGRRPKEGRKRDRRQHARA